MTGKLEATEKLYTAHPFGEFDYDRDKYFETMLCTAQAAKLEESDVVYDIGCGKGFLIGFLGKRIRNRIVGIDISDSALDYCRRLGYEVYKMDNSKLGLADEVSGFTLSNGVIHHTPDARKSFAELVRITRRGKTIYLSVYKRHFVYHYLYVATAPVRRLYRNHPSLVYKAIFPLFYAAYFIPIFLVLERRIIGRETGMTQFADQILTPQATFHTRAEIERWVREENCRIVEFAVEKKGQMISAIVQRL